MEVIGNKNKMKWIQNALFDENKRALLQRWNKPEEKFVISLTSFPYTFGHKVEWDESKSMGMEEGRK